MPRLQALYCTDCRTTIICNPQSMGYGCNCDDTVSMEHVLGMPEAERLEQDHSVGHMLAVPEIPDMISVPLLSDEVAAECRREMAQAQQRGWRTR